MRPTGASGLSAGSEVVWSSGRYVFQISLITQGAKPALSRAALIALARHMQRRAT